MLNERQEQMLLSLRRFDYMNIRQFQILHDLKSDRNAYRIIKQLEPYMNHFVEGGRKVFYLNKNGREAINGDKIRKKTTTAKHYIMRNDLYIHLGKPENWRNEIRIKYESDKDKIINVADAHFKTDRHYIVEIDNMQKMGKNRLKIDKYRRLVEKNVFKGMPGLIWVTTTAYRQAAIRDLCDGLDVMVFLNTDIN